MIEAYALNFLFPEPVRIAGKTFHHSPGCLLLIRDQGMVGYGEAVPDQDITKDTQESVFQYLQENASLISRQIRKGISLKTIQETHQLLPAGSPTARAAIDFALHDLWGKKENQPISRLYAKKITSSRNCLTVFGKDQEKTALDVEKILKAYPHLQVIKIKLLGHGDLERCHTIKETVKAMNRNISYVLDCNQAYPTSAEAIAVLTQLKEILQDVILIEEPVPARQWGLLKEVTDGFDLPVFADESAVNMEDVLMIIKKKCAKGINIKLQKTGGIWPAKMIAEKCEKHGLQVMVGCMFESALGIAAGIHFAQSTKKVVLTDLDYDLQLPDIYRYRPTFEDGARKSTDKPGLGVELDFAKIEALKKASKVVFARKV